MIKYRAKIDYRLAEDVKYVSRKYQSKKPSWWDGDNFITWIIYGASRDKSIPKFPKNIYK